MRKFLSKMFFFFWKFIYITNVMCFSFPVIILASFIKTCYFFYHSLAEFLMGYLGEF